MESEQTPIVPGGNVVPERHRGRWNAERLQVDKRWEIDRRPCRSRAEKRIAQNGKS